MFTQMAHNSHSVLRFIYLVIYFSIKSLQIFQYIYYYNYNSLRFVQTNKQTKKKETNKLKNKTLVWEMKV